MRQRYTLIDLFIVTVVIGISVAVVVFSLELFQEWRTATACRADKQRVEVAAHAYHLLTGNEARSVDQLVSEGFLKDHLPTGNGYSVTVTAGAVTASGACS